MKKKVSVVGLGESGLASALFLKKRGFDVFVSDTHDSEILQRRAEILRKEGIAFELGRHSFEKVSRSDWAFISPGILPSSEIYQSLHRKGIPLGLPISPREESRSRPHDS